ncbi:MAG: S41 family peptidase [Patescibacteria group bacterium]
MIKKVSIPLIIVIALLAGFGGGIVYSNRETSTQAVIQKLINQDDGKAENVDFSLFWKVWDSVSSKYVDKSKLDNQKMVYGAIEGMVNAIGDPYTVFFEPVVSTKFKEEITGSFAGVGIELGDKDGVMTVIAPLPDTPAMRAGVQSGDKILSIDGVSTSGVSTDEGVKKIRGKAGTKVTIIFGIANNKTREVTITREVIKVPTVVWKMIEKDGKHVAYVQIYSFNEVVDGAFAKAVQEILKSNADSLIVDLRGNPGGLLDSAINLAGYMLPKGQTVVSEVFRDGTKNNFTADGNSSLLKYPTVFLINGGSASASEILAGAIHDNRHIKLVGEKSFGKGSVQELQDFGGGSSLKVTIAKWYTPAGINISTKGIEADVEVKLTDEQRKATVVGDYDKDLQLQKAIEALR